jgi:hypothetical protein
MPHAQCRLIFALVLLLPACSKDEGSTDDTGDCVPNGLFADIDGDGFGDLSAPLCDAEEGVPDSTDCDDGLDTVNPGAAEQCGTLTDDNCDGELNSVDAEGCTLFYADADGDGFAGADDSACLCKANETYVSADANDCDDSLDSVHPEAPEDCASTWDDNCDGVSNEKNADNCIDYYVDMDGDGWGGASNACYCEPTGSYVVSDPGDCDDDRANAHPGAVELCNGLQEDCSIANWSASFEDGQVSFEDESGLWADESTSFTGAFEITEPGTWHVCEGTHAVSLHMADLEGVQIYGRGDVEDILLYAANDRAITIKNSTVELRNLSIQGINPNSEGGAISILAPDLQIPSSEFHLTIDSCRILNSEAFYGAGIYAYAARLLIQDSVILGNSGIAAAGLFMSNAEAQLVNTEITGNTALSNGGGGIYAQSATLKLQDSEVHDNFAQGSHGAGIYLKDSVLDLNDSKIHDNVSDRSGAGIYAYGSSVDCTASSGIPAGIFANKRSGTTGSTYGYGVFLLMNSSLTATTCDFGHISSHTLTDNSPADICLYRANDAKCTKVDYANDATFSCSVATNSGSCN